MRASISAPFVDTAADELIWTLTHPPIDPLATRTVSVGGTEVELHVLGASHQVILRSGENELVETVACLPGVGGDLPDSADRSLQGVGTYRFDSIVEALSRTELSRRVDHLHSEVAHSTGGLFVAFLGDPLAVTALHLPSGEGRSLRWRTWHSYPQSSELVITTTTVTP